MSGNGRGHGHGGQSRQFGLRTRIIHAGGPPEGENAPSAPPIVPSSSYLLPPRYIDDYTAPGGGWDRDGAEARELFEYSRLGNPTVRHLERKVAAAEGAEECAVFGSGMAAASSLLLHKLGAGDHLVLSDVCYIGVSELAHDTLPRFGVAVSRVDSSDPERVAAAMRPNTRLVHVETPANPMLRLTDIAAVAEVAHRGGAELSVDATWATPVATRPVELGADWVLQSLTKYYTGHGDTLGGAVAGRAEAVAALKRDARIHHGGIMSPFEAWLTMRGMDTLPLRMDAHETGAMEVARYLEAHPKVTRVLYPGLPSHPQHELALRQMENFSGMLAFRVADGAAAARRMARELEVFHYAVSLGHQRSLLVYLATDAINADSFRLDPDGLARYRAWAGDGLFRVSVGLEDPEDLCADLGRVLDRL